MIVDQGLELLTEDQCRQLLVGGEVGRVGITMGAPGDLPGQLPRGGRRDRLPDGTRHEDVGGHGGPWSFEVDDYQLADRSGWSVLAVGRAEVVDDPDTGFLARLARLEPFVDGTRTAIVRIEPLFLSGRRLVHTPRYADS